MKTIIPAALLIFCAGCSRSASDPAFSVTAEMRKAAVQRHSEGQLQQALSRIEGWHAKEKTPIASALKPGLTDSAIDGLFTQIGCKPAGDLRSLWKWRNGHADASGAMWFVWYHRFLPIEDAFEERRRLLADPSFLWNEHWIPVFQFQDEWYFVECSTAGAAASPLLYYFTEQGKSRPYMNVTTFLATAADVLDQRAVFLDSSGQMKDDIPRVRSIYRKHNPGLAFPYFVPE